MITLTDDTKIAKSFNRSNLVLEQSVHINRMITLTVITLSGFYCTTNFKLSLKKFSMCGCVVEQSVTVSPPTNTIQQQQRQQRC